MDERVSSSLTDIWIAYKKVQPTAESLRNQLIEAYLHLAHQQAKLIHAKVPNEVQLEDLVSAGVFGLIDAIEKFDLDCGVKFETYAPQRIRGAILDEIRNMDWIPRLVRFRTNLVRNASAALYKKFGRNPTEEEIRQYLQITHEEYKKVKDDTSSVATVSLSRKWFDTDSNKEVTEIDTIADRKTDDPSEAPSRENLRKAITMGLDRIQRLVITLYEFEGLTMAEVGAILFMSESRVSQIHSLAILQIRSNESLRQYLRLK